MKFSYDIGGLPNRIDHEKIFKTYKAAGIDTIAYNFVCLNNCNEVLEYTSYIDNAKKIRAALDEAGVTCNQTYSPFSLKTGDERFSRFEPNYGNIVKALEFSSILGAKRMVCYAIQFGEEADQKEGNYKIYRSLIGWCKKFDIQIALCSGFPKYINSSVMKTPWSTTEEYIEFVKSLDSPYITACANIGTISGLGCPAEDFVKDIGTPLLTSIHFQDTEKYHDVHLPPYFKQFNWAQIVANLKEMGYEGEFTFESPFFMHKYPEDLLPAIAELFAAIGNYVINLA